MLASDGSPERAETVKWRWNKPSLVLTINERDGHESIWQIRRQKQIKIFLPSLPFILLRISFYFLLPYI